MDWSRIKTIFIITFLILDVYLLSQFLIKRDTSQYEVRIEATIEDQLKADEIEITFDLPKASIKDQYVSARPKNFTEKETKSLKNQTVEVNQKTVLLSNLDKPYQIDTDFEPVSLAGFIAENVLYGSEYQFWEKDEQEKTITYFQTYENKFFYQNINGILVFHLNDKNQIVSYEQTLLEDIKKYDDSKEEVFKPLKAIEILHQRGMLEPKSKITSAELGYSTIVPLASSQVFAPTWRFEVNNKESLYVNAFEGQVIEFDIGENEVTE
ncbi:two-component system regulatory protein YycI [Bacillus sp. EB01]|uniref:two-component system regulatory protein YycI n=1 Tax=Bacillus sp. EB01 TaxID=1347086 RepID=UPI0005C4BC03|nr:two-component system regulatory protein YycI [Bacillus sp. EB01]